MGLRDDLHWIVEHNHEIERTIISSSINSSPFAYVIVGPATIAVERGKYEADFISNFEAKRLANRKFEPGSKVIGGNWGKDPRIVVIDSSSTKISSVDGEGTKTWVTSPSPIRTTAAIAGCWLIAFITEDDELCVYSAERKTFLLRMQMGAS
jgi:hypothetical protein